MKQTHGFTLIELVITMGILAVSATIFLALLSWGFRLSRESSVATTLQVETAEAIDQMARDIRGASDIISASDSQLVLDLYPRYPSPAPDRISYSVSGTRLERGVIPPTGSPPTYNATDEVVRGLTNNMAATTGLFRYYDENDNELTAPVSIGAVTVVEITISVRDESLRNPQPLTSTSRAHLRNRKTNL